MNAGMFKGYKTYILAGVAALTALAGWLTGDLSTQDALQQLWAAGVAASIRHGAGS